MHKQIARYLRASIACLLTLSALMLTCCSRQMPSATDLMAMLLAELEHPELELYFDGAAEDGRGWLSEAECEALYDGHSPTLLADRYAIALCRDDRSYEIHLYYALNAEDAMQIEELLRGRLEVLQGKDNYLYDPDSLAASGTVWKRGKWVCLLVTEDNRLAKEIIKKRL